MGIFNDLLGTSKSFFKLGISGVRLKNNAGNLSVRNTGDSADAELTTSKINVSGDAIVLNSDAAGSGTDWGYTVNRPSFGMTAAVNLTLPTDDGTANQVLQTDGTGILSWASAGSTASSDKVDTTTLAFGSTSPLALFNTGVADVINTIEIIVDTAFDGTAPTVAIGIAGTTSKYSATSDVDLKTVGVYQIHPGVIAQGAEALIATFNADASTAGSARIQVYYATPA
jgi:hypothetical protein